MFKVTYIFFFLFSISKLFAQNNSIDTIKVSQKVPFFLLNDTSILQSKIQVSRGDRKFDINKFIYNNTQNKPAVHISSSGIFYYNSLAISLFLEDKNKMYNKGFEFLKRDDYKKCMEINNIVYNFSLNCNKPKTISKVRVGHIMNKGWNCSDSINYDSPIFRIAEFSKDISDGEFRFGSSKLMMTYDNKQFNIYEGSNYKFYGMPIIVKQSIDYYLNNNTNNYFDIMPDRIYSNLTNMIFKNIKSQKSEGTNNTYSLEINEVFNKSSKIEIKRN